MPNPFFYGGRIENPEHFIGRKTELRAIFSALETFSGGQAQHISLVGERRIGKSSLLYHVTQTYRARLSQPERYRFVFVDLENPHCHTLGGLLQFILKGLGVPAAHNLTLDQFSAALEKLHDREKFCPVISLDEFEHLASRSEEFPNQVYETFRSLAGNNKAAFLTASRASLPAMIQQSNITSTFPNIFIRVSLGEFSADEAGQLIHRAVTCDHPFGVAELRLLREMGGRHPYKLQAAGSLLYLQKSAGAAINRRQVQALHAAQMEQAGLGKSPAWPQSAWRTLLEWLRSLGRAILGLFKEKEKISAESALLMGILSLLAVTLLLYFGLDALIALYRSLTFETP